MAIRFVVRIVGEMFDPLAGCWGMAIGSCSWLFGWWVGVRSVGRVRGRWSGSCSSLFGSWVRCPIRRTLACPRRLAWRP